MLAQQVKDFRHAAVAHLLQENQLLHLRLPPVVVVLRVRRNLDKRQLALHKKLLAGAVIDNNIRVRDGHNLIVVYLIVPQIQLPHFNRVFGYPRVHAVVAVQIKIDGAIDRRIGLRHHNPVEALGHMAYLMLPCGNPIHNRLALWMPVQPAS